MTQRDEAERLATRLNSMHSSGYGRDAAALLRSMAAEIERLTTECKSFEANAYKTKVEAQTTFDHMKSEIERKDTLLRECLGTLVDLAEAGDEEWSRDRPCVKYAFETIANIKTELGEQT